MSDEDTKNLLKSCAENLMNAVSRLENRLQDHPRPEQQLPTSSNQESIPSVSEEHRRLFGYRPPSSSRAACSSTPGSSANRTQLAPKRRVVTTSTGSRITIPVRNTWTRTFVCLQKRNITTAPTAIEKVNMAMAGLEEKSICFSKGGNSDHVHQKILEAFPLLSDAGGYEILRTGERGNRQLLLISIPPGGYTVAYLKATINTAKGYIRPHQKDLELNSTGTAEHGQMQIPVSPRVSCVNCHCQVPMDMMRKHEQTCSGGSSGAYFSCCSHSDVDEKQSADASPFPTTEEINHLSEMFPDKSCDALKAYLQVEGSFSKAVTTLLAENTVTDDDDDLLMSCFEPSENCSDTQDLKTELLNLQKHFSQDQREKLKIDEEDLMNDAMAYYKDQNFDPRKKLRIVYRGQAAADTGGVIRQFYSQLLSVITDTFFRGDTYRSPIYNCDMVASGVMKLVGTIIVHSILQGGPGFPVFSPAVYNYLAKGDLHEAMKGVTVKDCSIQMEQFISKVAQAGDVSQLDKDETTDVLSDCGLSMTLTNDNKMRVIQSLIVHDAIGKPKILLDQLREGLATLGFRSRMQLYPEVFKELFVAGEKEIQGSDVKEMLLFPLEMSDVEKNIMEYMNEFIVAATPKVLKAFLTFATGAPCLPEFGLGRIRMEFDDAGSIFSSTCTKNVTLPRNFPDKDTFLAALQAVCDNGGKAFTSV